TRPVALVCMPFGSTARPSLGLSLLEAGLNRQGLACDVHYLNLRFAEILGSHRYDRIADSTAEALIGEWIFAADLFGDRVAEAGRFFEAVLPHVADLQPQIAEFIEAREAVERYLDECECVVRWQDYALVGFTSTFQQNAASLALAKRIKSAHPHVQIAFGGANCEGDMGLALHRLFKFVDYVCSVDSDSAFPVLARRVTSGQPVGDLAGVIWREDGWTVAPSVKAAPVMARTEANNLCREQVRLAREAGIQQIQPGIESLSSNVLRLMRKDVSAMQNIQLLRWCAEYEVEPSWNLIAGFPGEDPAD